MPGSLVFSIFSGQTLETSGQSKGTLPASTKKAQPLVQPSDVASQVLFLRTQKGFKKAKGASSRASLYLDNERETLLQQLITSWKEQAPLETKMAASPGHK